MGRYGHGAYPRYGGCRVQPSDDVRNGMLRFYEAFSSGDPGAIDAVVTRGDAVVIGTDARQWTVGRESWVQGYREAIELFPNITVRSGHDLVAYAEGSLGWATDRPTFLLADGLALPARTSAVLRQEDGTWKLVHLHVSFGVPDDKLDELASVLFS